MSGGVYEGPSGMVERPDEIAWGRQGGGSCVCATYRAHAIRAGAPVVKLYTKADCTLCDKVRCFQMRNQTKQRPKVTSGLQVKDVLKTVQEDAPHSLVQV